MATSPSSLANLIAKFREELVEKGVGGDELTALVLLYAEALFEVSL